MQKSKRGDAGFLPKNECQKLQRLYTQRGAAFGCVRKLMKASKPPVSKLRLFLHLKPSYARFTLAPCQFRRMKAFARFKSGFLLINLAYVAKLTKDTNSLKCLIARQDLFDRSVDTKGTSTGESNGTVHAISKLNTKKNEPEKILADKGTKFAVEFLKVCKTE